MNADVRFYLALFWRRLPWFLLVFVLIAASGLFTAFTLPPVYQSQMRLVVESAQIPGDLAESTVSLPAQEQLQIFETRLLARDNLLDIANRLQVFPDQAKMNPDQIVQEMRAATAISSSAGRDQATLMTVAFLSTNPRMAADVLNDYLTFLLEEDAQYRAERAGQTQAFFQQEVDRLNVELSTQSARILEFKNQNADALPDGMDYRRDLQRDLQDRIARFDTDLADMQEQRLQLQQVFETTGQTGTTNTGAMTPDQRRIAELRNQLTELEAVYAPDSPRLNVLRTRIAQLEAVAAAANGTIADGDTDPATTMFNMQMAEFDARAEQVQEQRDRFAAQLATVEDAIARTAGNAIALEALQRDFDNVQAQYNTTVDRLARASTGERIEALSRGQRVTVVEPPAIPTDPAKPNRKLIAAAGIGAGLMLGLGLVLVIELLNTSVKRSSDLINGLGITPLATIPYMRTQKAIVRRNLSLLTVSLLIGVAIPVALLLIHTYYLPFDVLARKVAAKIGLYL